MLASRNRLWRPVIPVAKGKSGVASDCEGRIVLEGENTLDSAVASATESGKFSDEMFAIRGGGVLTLPAMSDGSSKLLVLPVE